MILSTRSRQLGESRKIGLAVRVASARFVSSLILFLSFLLFISRPAGAQTIASLPACKRTITADVVALSQPIMLNRLGAAIPDGLVFALKQRHRAWQRIRLGSGQVRDHVRSSCARM